MIVRIEVSREIGPKKWTVRVNGHFVCDFKRDGEAWETGFRLAKALGMTEADVGTIEPDGESDDVA